MKFYSIKILILVILCNMVALAGYYYFFGEIEAKTKVATNLTDTIDIGQQKNSRLSLLRSTIKNTEAGRQKISTLLLPSESEVPFIEQMENLAKSNNLGVKTNNVSSATSTDVTKVFHMQSEVTGSWNGIMNLLNQIDNLPYDVRVQSVSMNKQEQGKASGLVWVASINISVTESI